MKNKKKALEAYQINKKIRRSWDLNPVTKVEPNEKRSHKKRRQKENKEIKRFNIDEFN